MRPGYYEVTSPVPHPVGRLAQSGVGGGWASPSNKYDPGSAATTWGYIAARHSDKAVVGHMDGHIKMLGLEDMRDMTRWANRATRATWTFQPGG